MSRPARLSSISYNGTGGYFVTTCTHERRRIFDRAAVVGLTLMHFLQSAEQTDVEVTAYCFMPDHLHLLVTVATAIGDLDRFMRRAKQTSGHAFAQSDGGKLWQTGYHDRVLRSDEDALNYIAYMVENPIRAGLVHKAGDWPHWGAARYTREEVLEAIALRPMWRPNWRR
jgi:REP element-mobilizing transposase RayT